MADGLGRSGANPTGVRLALCEIHRRPRQKNGVCPSCYFRDWYQRNRDDVIARSEQWKRENRPKHLAGKRRWQKRRPHVIRQAMRRLRARLAGTEVRPYTEAQVYARDGWWCYLCQRSIDPAGTGAARPSFDHLLPISMGGPDTLENVRPAHVGCNSRKGRRAA